MLLVIVGVLAAGGGLVVGWLVGSRPLVAAKVQIATLERDLAAAQEASGTTTSALTDTFKVQAREIFEEVVGANRANEEALRAERDRTTAATLAPLQETLTEYRTKLEEFERRQSVNLGDVKAAAERLAQLQEATMTETKRLTTLLGRSQERGRWGESQLYRILELSGLLPHVDFDTQATITTSTSTRRPDAVVRLPQGMSVAIDAKAPYEAYDAAGAATSDAERERLMKEYGKALRNHITDLGKKAYWDGLGLSPQFVVCFVPSDHLLAAAFASDPTLLEAGLASRVLVAGPTTLMGMLWSVALGWQQFSLQANMEEVLKLAQRLMDRAGTAYGHLDKLGRAINGLATTYGQVVGSLENSLFVTVRAMGALALPATTTDDLAPSELTTVTTRALDPERWPTPAATELPEGPAN